MARLITGNQLKAARALAGLKQSELAQLAGLHVNSVRYLERQKFITPLFSAKRVAEAMEAQGVELLDAPPGVRLLPSGGPVVRQCQLLQAETNPSSDVGCCPNHFPAST